MSDRLEFDTTIGVDVKGDLWTCVEIPDSAEFFGTKKTVRVDAQIDGVLRENIGAMVTGRGGHMISLTAPILAKLGKGLGDPVHVVITKR